MVTENRIMNRAEDRKPTACELLRYFPKASIIVPRSYSAASWTHPIFGGCWSARRIARGSNGNN